MMRLTPILLSAALLLVPAAGFALDRASASADQGRVAANDTTPSADTEAPKPIKKKLHRGWPKKVPTAAAKKKVTPTAASDSATKTN